ncbi:unnamed protein product [Rotaria sp. Silwood2]|nr:unnamed protein product [Rotaria sp. Silwood2]CAF4337391.1 unnamed protein product [Rotaria sp. Silwood2]
MRQGIDQKLLVGTSIICIFYAQYCNGLKINSLSIDFDPLPFTAGYIVNVTDNYLDVEIQPPHRTDINRQVQGLIRYDRKEMRPAFGSKTYHFYQVQPTNINTSLVSTSILRIPLTSRTELTIGDAIVTIYYIFIPSILVTDSTDLIIQSINIHSYWRIALVTNRVKRVIISDYYVILYDGRWLSANSDCIHFIRTSEYISLSNSKCQRQSDDGLNVLTPYIIVAKAINTTTVINQAFN